MVNIVTVSYYLPFARYFYVSRVKIAIFVHGISGGTPSNINVIYTSLKSTISGLQSILSLTILAFV